MAAERTLGQKHPHTHKIIIRIKLAAVRALRAVVEFLKFQGSLVNCVKISSNVRIGKADSCFMR